MNLANLGPQAEYTQECTKTRDMRHERTIDYRINQGSIQGSLSLLCLLPLVFLLPSASSTFPLSVPDQDKTSKHVIPTLAQLAQSSRKAFVKTSETLHHHISPIFGEWVSAVVSFLLSCTLLLIPVAGILLLLNRIRVILTIRKAILIANLYLTLYCAVLIIVCAVIGGEPMRLLSIASIGSFMLLQIVQAGGYLIYLALLVSGWMMGVDTCACTTCQTSKPASLPVLHRDPWILCGLKAHLLALQSALYRQQQVVSLVSMAAALPFCLHFFFPLLLSSFPLSAAQALGVYVAYRSTFSQYQPVPSGPGTPARWKYADIVEAAAQLGIAIAIGVHYYIKVFELAMVDKLPQISIVEYCIYFVLFGVLTWLSRGAAKPDQKSH